MQDRKSIIVTIYGPEACQFSCALDESIVSISCYL
jgi:hypothetical protein